MSGRYLLAGIFCLGIFAGNLLAAETQSQDTFTLGEIVVTGEKADVSDIGISDTL